MNGLSMRKVGEIAQDPRARAVLERLALDHCCGAQLTLAAAAAAVGVPLDKVIRALDVAMTATLDVRGLEPPQPLVRVLERLETLGAGERLEVVLDRRPLLLYPQLEARGFTHTTDEATPGVVRVFIARGQEAA
jgi:tRNA 2-thiouridine synthesizing protein A